MKTLFRLGLLMTPLFVSACTIHHVGKHKAVTLDTGNEVIDAASYVVAGARLQKKLKNDPENVDKEALAKDPVVKDLNAAMKKAKDRQYGVADAASDD
jgi:hypothetical protein